MGDETPDAADFAQAMSGMFGLQERFVGPEMHQAMVKRAEAETEMNTKISLAMIEQADAKTRILRQVGGLIAVITLLTVLFGVSGLVKWWLG